MHSQIDGISTMRCIKYDVTEGLALKNTAAIAIIDFYYYLGFVKNCKYIHQQHAVGG